MVHVSQAVIGLNLVGFCGPPTIYMISPDKGAFLAAKLTFHLIATVLQPATELPDKQIRAVPAGILA